MILPLDVTLGEDYLREAVEKAESFFGGSGVDYMFHNAAFERPVSNWILCKWQLDDVSVNLNTQEFSYNLVDGIPVEEWGDDLHVAMKG